MITRGAGDDVFGMIPPPTSQHDNETSKARFDVIKSGRSPGIGGDVCYGYIANLYQRVVDNFARFGHAVDGRRIALRADLRPPAPVLVRRCLTSRRPER